MGLRPYTPKNLPLEEIPWADVADLLGKAHFTLGRMEEILRRARGKKSLFAKLVKQEADYSLRSQGRSVGRAKENYLHAMRVAMRQVKKKPISLALIKEIHRELYKGSLPRKSIGRIRLWQNWMGPKGCLKKDAYFLPPKPDDVPPLMKNLLAYGRRKEKDPLLQLAIFFAQFLIIHPFMDGNGRVARILVPLFLYKKKVLSHPFFFCSHFLNKHRPSYFLTLNNISFDGDWSGWIRFFLGAIIEDGERSCKMMEKKR